MSENKEEKQPNDYLNRKNQPFYYFSFVLTYILMITTGTITFIEALRTNNDVARHIFNLETCISIVAGFFYYKFLNFLDDVKKEDITNKLNEIRYLDWSITTPMMLLALMLFLSSNENKSVHLLSYLSVIFFNYIMLIFGYWGETGKIQKMAGFIFSFLAFFAMFGILFFKYVFNTKSLSNKVLFGFYFLTWSIYGMNYYSSSETKNIVFNILDLISKCLVGLFMWAYFTKVIVL
jgi:bacteriorhodopsin